MIILIVSTVERVKDTLQKWIVNWKEVLFLQDETKLHVLRCLNIRVVGNYTCIFILSQKLSNFLLTKKIILELCNFIIANCNISENFYTCLNFNILHGRNYFVDLIFNIIF